MATNWTGSIIADGTAASANFGALDLTADTLVRLDGDRTLGNPTVADTTVSSPASWTLDNAGVATNNLTLAGVTPTIPVNALGTAKAAIISAVIEVSAGLTKAGSGTLGLSGVKTYTGGLPFEQGKFRRPQAWRFLPVPW